MRQLRTRSFCLIVGVILLPSARAEMRSDTSTAGRHAQNRSTLRLVRLLGDDSFAVREQASRDLIKLGPAALPVLREALSDPELERRFRSRRLIDAIQRQDLARRVAAFLKESDASEGHGLPGWTRYRAAVGTDAAARKLFADMQRAEAKLFRLSRGDDKRWQNEFEKRCAELVGQMFTHRSRKTNAASVAAVLFLGSDRRLKIPAQLNILMSRFVSDRSFRQMLSGGDSSTAARRLLGLWVKSPAGGDAYRKVALAIQYNLKEGLVPGLELVRAGAGGRQVEYGLLVVGRFGNRSHISLVEKQLDNKTLTSRSRRTGREVYRCEVRDVALAVLVHLTAQDAGPYHFARLRQNKRYLFSPGSAGFSNDTVRRSARDRWNRWRAAHSRPAADPTPKRKVPIPG